MISSSLRSADAMCRLGSFEKGWKVLPDESSDDTSQAQGVVTGVSRAFDGVAAGKSKADFSDGQMGLP